MGRFQLKIFEKSPVPAPRRTDHMRRKRVKQRESDVEKALPGIIIDRFGTSVADELNADPGGRAVGIQLFIQRIICVCEHPEARLCFGFFVSVVGHPFERILTGPVRTDSGLKDIGISDVGSGKVSEQFAGISNKKTNPKLVSDNMHLGRDTRRSPIADREAVFQCLKRYFSTGVGGV